jgi:hypothetical protein
MFVKGMLSRIFGSKRDELKGGWRKLLTDILRNLYSSSSTIKLIKSGWMMKKNYRC